MVLFSIYLKKNFWVRDTAGILTKMNAQVAKKIYKKMGHTINKDEIDEANRILQ